MDPGAQNERPEKSASAPSDDQDQVLIQLNPEPPPGGAEPPSINSAAESEGDQSVAAQPADQQPSGRRKLGFNAWLIIAGLLWSALAVIAVVLFGIQVGSGAAATVSGGVVIATSTAVVGASAAFGGLAGFLFGIPKALQSEKVKAGDSKFISNSNLEQISDWLTKIIVGVGLVQISSLPAALGTLGQNLAPAFGGAPESPSFAIGIILYSLVIAFLLVYMWTRTRFLEILEQMALDRKKLQLEFEIAEQKTDRKQSQRENQMLDNGPSQAGNSPQEAPLNAE